MKEFLRFSNPSLENISLFNFQKIWIISYNGIFFTFYNFFIGYIRIGVTNTIAPGNQLLEIPFLKELSNISFLFIEKESSFNCQIRNLLIQLIEVSLIPIIDYLDSLTLRKNTTSQINLFFL